MKTPSVAILAQVGNCTMKLRKLAPLLQVPEFDVVEVDLDAEVEAPDVEANEDARAEEVNKANGFE